jgi:hypothetical protein
MRGLPCTIRRHRCRSSLTLALRTSLNSVCIRAQKGTRIFWSNPRRFPWPRVPRDRYGTWLSEEGRQHVPLKSRRKFLDTVLLIIQCTCINSLTSYLGRRCRDDQRRSRLSIEQSFAVQPTTQSSRWLARWFVGLHRPRPGQGQATQHPIVTF